jgi:hypothetical protein
MGLGESIKHQDIMDSIKIRFQTILTANGYNTDLGNNVVINKSNKLLSSSNSNAINITDINAEALTALSGGVVSYFDYKLLIEATLFFISGTADINIRKGIWDILKAIGTDVTWSGYAINTYPSQGSPFFELLFDQQENIIVGARVNFIIEFRTKQWANN